MDEEQIINQYYGKVKFLADKYSRNTSETEDLIQEGLIGLLSAARNYKPEYGVSFSSYSNCCITNRMLDFIKSRTEELLDDDFDIQDFSANPEQDYLLKEYLSSFKLKLSEYEFNVLNLMLDGYTNACIADRLGKSVGSVYNASQRIRQKLSAEFN